MGVCICFIDEDHNTMADLSPTGYINISYIMNNIIINVMHIFFQKQRCSF